MSRTRTRTRKVEQPLPKYFVPAQWFSYDVSSSQIVERSGYTGISAKTLACSFLAPDTSIVRHIYSGRGILSSFAQGVVTSVQDLMPVTVNPEDQDVFRPVTVQDVTTKPQYYTQDRATLLRLVLQFALSHPKSDTIVQLVQRKLEEHFDTYATGTMAQLKKQRADITAYFTSQNYRDDVQTFYGTELTRRYEYLLSLLALAYTSEAEAFRRSYHDDTPHASVLAKHAVAHAMRVTLRHFGACLDGSGIWLAPDGMVDTTHIHEQVIKESWQETVDVMENMFRDELRCAMELMYAGWSEA